MNETSTFHVLTVGWGYPEVVNLWNRIATKSRHRFSHILLPGYTLQCRPDSPPRQDFYFFRNDIRQPMPEPDLALLASLERDGVPTVHNMILGDPMVSKIDYQDALRFTTFLARRLIELYREINPSVIIGSFDCLHSGVGLAVARHLNIPWYAMNFSVIPMGYACFCDTMSANSRVLLHTRSQDGLQDFAEEWLQRFEGKQVQAYAYIAPGPLSAGRMIANLPRRMVALVRTMRNARLRKYLQFTEGRNLYSVPAVLAFLRRSARARKAIAAFSTVKVPPKTPYVLFGLHLQPESSIDVWAPFFSNQMWVVELLSRSIPPTHKLLVKVHKSDISNHGLAQLRKMCSFPGVEIVAPFADMRSFIQAADLLVTIQGTMGLEGALLGKQVIVLGDSPVIEFPSVSRVGRITELPALMRSKLGARPPSRNEIATAYAKYLTPFVPASHNDWSVTVSDREIDGYVNLFDDLKAYLCERADGTREAAP